MWHYIMLSIMVLPRVLAGHIKIAFLTVSSEQWKRKNASHYESRNVEESFSLNSDCMVYDKGIGIKLQRHGYK